LNFCYERLDCKRMDCRTCRRKHAWGFLETISITKHFLNYNSYSGIAIKNLKHTANYFICMLLKTVLTCVWGKQGLNSDMSSLDEPVLILSSSHLAISQNWRSTFGWLKITKLRRSLHSNIFKEVNSNDKGFLNPL